MNHKVLLADDSLTIQKVIKITLANQPYEITDCSSDEELFQKLAAVKPKLVFLDFNLSEKYTGYELSAKIKSILPSAKVLLLLGTFDTVDDAAMEKCGASDKIVKPFDSNKFIAICKQLIDTFDSAEEIEYPKTDSHQSSIIKEDEEDQWTVAHSTEHKTITPVEVAAPVPQMNALSKEISDWGMSVPNIINDSSIQDKLIDLPPVIGDKPLEAVKFPEESDLDYPSQSQDESIKPSPASLAKLISIESLSNPIALEIEGNYVKDEADINKIQEQIKDEVENDLWKADEFEDLRKEVSTKLDEVKHSFHPSANTFDDSLFKPLDENEHIPMAEPSLSSTGISRTEIEQMVKACVKEYMDQMFQKNVEKISWEVIPDLAENLIRQELTKISTKIINEDLK
ncbi:MAG: response regulator [Bacteriovoracaceae bacterium]